MRISIFNDGRWQDSTVVYEGERVIAATWARGRCLVHRGSSMKVFLPLHTFNIYFAEAAAKLFDKLGNRIYNPEDKLFKYTCKVCKYLSNSLGDGDGE